LLKRELSVDSDADDAVLRVVRHLRHCVCSIRAIVISRHVRHCVMCVTASCASLRHVRHCVMRHRSGRL
jgi:hypothetical protein